MLLAVIANNNNIMYTLLKLFYMHVGIDWLGCSMDPRDDYEDFGNQSVGQEDNEEVALFRSLEHELESLVQRYRVPPDELRQLFEVSDVWII